MRQMAKSDAEARTTGDCESSPIELAHGSHETRANQHTHTHKRELVQWMQGSLYRHTVQCTLEHFLGPLVKATELAHRETRSEGIEAGPKESRQ